MVDWLDFANFKLSSCHSTTPFERCSIQLNSVLELEIVRPAPNDRGWQQIPWYWVDLSCYNSIMYHGFSRKGPINSASSVCLSVRPFICNADISGSGCQKFLIFCTKLEQHKCRKVTFSDFRKKLLSPCGRAQKIKFGPKLDFFKDCFRTAHQNFSIFCMKLDNNKAFQTMYMLSSGKLLPRSCGGQEVKFGPKIDFFKK